MKAHAVHRRRFGLTSDDPEGFTLDSFEAFDLAVAEPGLPGAACIVECGHDVRRVESHEIVLFPSPFRMGDST